MTQFNISDNTFRLGCLWTDIAHIHICTLTSEKEAASGVERLVEKKDPVGPHYFGKSEFLWYLYGINSQLMNTKQENPCYVTSYHLNYYFFLLYHSSHVIPFLSDAWFLFLCSSRLNTSFPNHIIISFIFFPAPNKADSTRARAVVGTLKQSIIVIGSCADVLELCYFSFQFGF